MAKPRSRSQKPPNEKKRPPSNSYLEYSGLTFQMLVVIGLGVWGGMKLDQRIELGFPAFTVGLTLLSVIVAMVMVILKVMRSK